MSEKLDVAKMEAAFKRAAHKALHGTREERSGRFLLKAKPKSASAARRDRSQESAKQKA